MGKKETEGKKEEKIFKDEPYRKKCPNCMKYSENETTRFCKSCGTELFFEARFGKKNR